MRTGGPFRSRRSFRIGETGSFQLSGVARFPGRAPPA
jgi:hypothetical protein